MTIVFLYQLDWRSCFNYDLGMIIVLFSDILQRVIFKKT